MIKLGVIGCGFIAQDMHLPLITGTEGGGIPGLKVTGLCDVDEDIVKGVAERYHIDTITTDYHELLDTDIDAVGIFTSDQTHAQIVIDALKAEKHVFVEKPLALTLIEIDTIEDTLQKAKRILQVGYMKRYDLGYQLAKEEFGKMRDISLIRCHKFMSSHRFERESVVRLISSKKIRVRNLSREESSAQYINIPTIRRQLGNVSPKEVAAYVMCLQTLGHTLDLLCDVFGKPDAVLCTEIKQLGRYLISMIDYGKTIGLCEWGNRATPLDWDEALLAYSPERNVSVHFSSSYVKYHPGIVKVVEKNNVVMQKTLQSSYEEAFRREWDGFVQCVTEEKPPLANIDGARAVTELCLAMIRCHKTQTRTPLAS